MIAAALVAWALVAWDLGRRWVARERAIEARLKALEADCTAKFSSHAASLIQLKTALRGS